MVGLHWEPLAGGGGGPRALLEWPLVQGVTQQHPLTAGRLRLILTLTRGISGL